MKILSKIKAAFIFAEFTTTVGVVIALMYLFKKHHRKIRRVWAKMQMKAIGFTIETKGKLDETADMIILNHQSILDIVIMEILHPGDPAWVGKKEITKIPFWGRILDASDMIVVDRDDKRSLIKLIKDAKDRLKNGRTVAMFPEGTRSDGKGILEFKEGPKFLAEKLGLKVQPVVILNSRNAMDSQNFEVRGGAIKVIYLDAISPKKDENWYEKMREDMKKTLSSALAEQEVQK